MAWARGHKRMILTGVQLQQADGRKLHRHLSSNITLTITQLGYSTPTVTTLRL